MDKVISIVSKRKRSGPNATHVIEQRKRFLNLFREECELLKKGEIKIPKRIDFIAWDNLGERGELLIDPPKTIGQVDGVEVEDMFDYRLELVIIGIHAQRIRGIDYMCMPNGRILATSIVATEGFFDLFMDQEDVIYTGEGGIYSTKNNKKTKVNQQLKGGNLALKNSIDEGNDVRVIRGFQLTEKKGNTFIYDGLYKVVDYWQEVGVTNKMCFQFKLRRCPNQKTINWNKYKSSARKIIPTFD